MVKLQRRFAYRYKTKAGETRTHYKFVINLPHDIVEQLGWTDARDLKLLVARGTLTMQAAKDQT